MTILTVITVPSLEKGKGVAPELLEAFTLAQFKEFAKCPGAMDGYSIFEDWMEVLLSNNIFIVVVDRYDKIQGCITAKNSHEETLNINSNWKPLIVTGFYSNHYDQEIKKGMIEVLIEMAVLTDHHQISIPNTTKLMRSLTDHVICNRSFDEVEVSLTGSLDYDCFDLSNFKTYGERAIS